MRKIRILKDMPGFKAGTIFIKRNDQWFPEGEYISMSYLKELFFSDMFEGEWFEKVKEPDPIFNVWYIRSTGEIIGPNKVTSLGHKLQLRRDFGNLFYSKKDAEIAQIAMKELLKMFENASSHKKIKIEFKAE